MPYTLCVAAREVFSVTLQSQRPRIFFGSRSGWGAQLGLFQGYELVYRSRVLPYEAPPTGGHLIEPALILILMSLLILILTF